MNGPLAGLLMLPTVALVIVISGLPAWVSLLGVALAFAGAGVAADLIPLPLLTAMPMRVLGLLESDILQALPLYVLMGALLNRLPLADVLFRNGLRLFGGGPRGALFSGLGLGVLLAPMSGSVGASVAMMTRTVHPRLAEAGVAVGHGGALLAAAGTLGVVVPPSLVLILLGDAMLRAHTEAINVSHAAVRVINTQDIFRGALIPAALLLVLYLGVTLLTARRAGVAAAVEAPPLRRRDRIVAALALLFIAGLLTGVTLGYLYAVEAAAAGAVAMFLFGVAGGGLTRRGLADALRDSMSITGALFALLVGATVFTLVVRAFASDQLVSAWLAGLGGHSGAALAAVLGSLALCAFVLDAFEIIFVVIPLVMPPLLVAVPDATWVAGLTLLILQASFMVPPFGFAVMLIRQRVGPVLAARQLAVRLLPYLLAQLLVVALVLAWPDLVWHEAPAPAAAPDAAPPDLQQLLERQN